MRSSERSYRSEKQKRDLRGTRVGDGTYEGDVVTASSQIVGHEAPSISCLPCGVLAHIFEGLGPRDLASASCVCKAWRHLVALEAAANMLWRSFYSARWQLSGALVPKRLTSSQQQHHHPPQLPPPTPGQAPRPQPSAPISCPPTTSTSSASTSPASSAPCSLSCSPETESEVRWQWAYGSKMLRLRSWSGRYSADQVVGHKSAVRAVRLLPSMNLLATASLDRTVRLWDLSAGLPLACSRPHGGTVRCLALDTSLLASGCSDNLVRVWHPRSSCDHAVAAARSTGAGSAAAVATPLYDISSEPYLLRGHTGPVSCLALDEVPAPGASAAGGMAGVGSGSGAIFSGSWDCTVRIWRQEEGNDGRGGDSSTTDGDDGDSGGGDLSSETVFGASGDGGTTSDGSSSSGGGGAVTSSAAAAASSESGGWSCTGVLQYSDWVYCCGVRGGNLLVAAGSEVVVTDAATGRVVRRFADLHDGGSVACLEGCRSGRLLFTAGGGDGLLLVHDLRMKQGSRVLWHHNAAVTGLAFEDPWLASSSADGCIVLQDSEQALAGAGGSGGCGYGPPGGMTRSHNSSSCRSLHCPAGQPALCLDLADQWLTAGMDSGVVRLWDFRGAAAAAERASASRAARCVAKAARAAARQQQQPQHRPSAYGGGRQPQQQQQAAYHHHQQQQQAPASAVEGPIAAAAAGSVAVGGSGGGAATGGGGPGGATTALPGGRDAATAAATDAAAAAAAGSGTSSLPLHHQPPPLPVPVTHRKARGGGPSVSGGSGGVAPGGGAGSSQHWRHGGVGSGVGAASYGGGYFGPHYPPPVQPAHASSHHHSRHHLHQQQQQQPLQQQPRQRVRAPWPRPPMVQQSPPGFRYVGAGVSAVGVSAVGAVASVTGASPSAVVVGGGGGGAGGGATLGQVFSHGRQQGAQLQW